MDWESIFSLRTCFVECQQQQCLMTSKTQLSVLNITKKEHPMTESKFVGVGGCGKLHTFGLVVLSRLCSWSYVWYLNCPVSYQVPRSRTCIPP